MSGTVALPVMPEAAEQSWLGLLDVADSVPDRWALVGGQMVHLLCWERGRAPRRVTTDGDVVVDVRAWPRAARDFTAVLQDTELHDDRGRARHLDDFVLQPDPSRLEARRLITMIAIA